MELEEVGDATSVELVDSAIVVEMDNRPAIVLLSSRLVTVSFACSLVVVVLVLLTSDVGTVLESTLVPFAPRDDVEELTTAEGVELAPDEIVEKNSPKLLASSRVSSQSLC